MELLYLRKFYNATFSDFKYKFLLQLLAKFSKKAKKLTCSLEVKSLGAKPKKCHRSLLTPEKVFSEYNEGLIFLVWIRNSV